MRNPFVHRAGGVLSADIAVPEHAREVEFYKSVLTTGESPLWRDDLMNNLGDPIIGLGARKAEYETLPVQWMPHFQVADIATSVERAIENGGQAFMHSKSADGQSQWAVLADPLGAAFGLIPVVANQPGGPSLSERCGCISWLSLASPEAQSSRDFYRQVIGWSANGGEAAGGEECGVAFEMRIDDETAAAEIHQLGDEGKSVPSVWLIHLPVGDLAESLRRVTEGGGEVVEDRSAEHYAVVRDPVGVYFALSADAT